MAYQLDSSSIRFRKPLVSDDWCSDSRFDSWGPRVREFVVGWLGQKKVLRDRVAGTMHVLMFWGFLMLASDMFDLATANAFSENCCQLFLLDLGTGWLSLANYGTYWVCFSIDSSFGIHT